MRSPKEVQEAIDVLTKLKEVMPQMSSFGDDNHETIDRQIKVLGDEIKQDELDQYYGDDSNQLQDALDWKNGKGGEDWRQDLNDDLDLWTQK